MIWLILIFISAIVVAIPACLPGWKTLLLWAVLVCLWFLFLISLEKQNTDAGGAITLVIFGWFGIVSALATLVRMLVLGLTYMLPSQRRLRTAISWTAPVIVFLGPIIWAVSASAIMSSRNGLPTGALAETRVTASLGDVGLDFPVAPHLELVPDLPDVWGVALRRRKGVRRAIEIQHEVDGPIPLSRLLVNNHPGGRDTQSWCNTEIALENPVWCEDMLKKRKAGERIAGPHHFQRNGSIEFLAFAQDEPIQSKIDNERRKFSRQDETPQPIPDMLNEVPEFQKYAVDTIRPKLMCSKPDVNQRRPCELFIRLKGEVLMQVNFRAREVDLEIVGLYATQRGLTYWDAMVDPLAKVSR